MKKKSETFNADRLRKLARHLIHGPIHVPMDPIDQIEIKIEFDGEIQTITPFFLSPLQESPFVFPDEWRYTMDGYAYWIKDRSRDTITSATKFFGINSMMLEHLLFPNRQNIDLFGGSILTQDATSEDIGYNILALIKSVHQLTSNVKQFRVSKNMSNHSKS